MFEWQNSSTAVVLFFVSYALLYGLLLVWSGLDQAPYAWRYGAVLAWLALWLPAEVEDLGWLSIAEAAVVLPVLAIARSRSSKPLPSNAEPFTFGLRHLFSIVLLVGGLLAICLRLPHRLEWHFVIACGNMFGALVLVSAWLALGRRPIWLRLIAYGVVTIAIWLAWRHVSYFHCTDELPIYRYWVWMEVPANFITCALVYGTTVPLLLLLVLSRLRTASTNRRRWWSGLQAITIVPAIFLAAWIHFHLAIPLRKPETIYPQPNSYEAIEALAKHWSGVFVPREDPDGTVACEAFVAAHADELTSIRRQLVRPGRAIIRYERDELFSRMETDILRVGRALELLEIKAAATDRAELGIDMLRFADTIANGALFVDHLMATSFDERSTRRISIAARDLDADACERLVARVAAFETSREPLEGVAERDLIFCLFADGWSGRSAWAALRLVGPDTMREALRLTKNSRTRRLAYLRLLQADLAIQAYHKRNGEYPASLSTLVPELLPAVPVDPFGSGPLRYRRRDDGYLLYSVGLNQADDDGVPARTFGPDSPGDLLLDPPPEEEPPLPMVGKPPA